MTLRAAAFLGIWHDIDPTYEQQWHRWHTYEHMPERAAVPGFLVGRRYMHNDPAPQRCFTLYEAQALDTFRSEPYLARLNAPTQWTKKMMPSFRNLVRGACRVQGSAEAAPGFGSAVQTLRLTTLEATANVQTLADELLSFDDILGAHIGICEHAATPSETRERSLRTQTTEERFHGVVIVEAIDRHRLGAQLAGIEARVLAAGGTIESSQGYDLAHVIGGV